MLPTATAVRSSASAYNISYYIPCTGISGAEAGAKYVLANYDIDEIIVLGPGTAGEVLGEVRTIDLDSFCLAESADISTAPPRQ